MERHERAAAEIFVDLSQGDGAFSSRIHRVALGPAEPIAVVPPSSDGSARVGLTISIHDPDHSANENRFVLVGMSHVGRLVVVVHADRGDVVRVISARLAEPRERRAYEQG